MTTFYIGGGVNLMPKSIDQDYYFDSIFKVVEHPTLKNNYFISSQKETPEYAYDIYDSVEEAFQVALVKNKDVHKSLLERIDPKLNENYLENYKKSLADAQIEDCKSFDALSFLKGKNEEGLERQKYKINSLERAISDQKQIIKYKKEFYDKQKKLLDLRWKKVEEYLESKEVIEGKSI